MRTRFLSLVCAASVALPCIAPTQDAIKVLAKALGAQRSVRATLVQCRTNGDTTITVLVQIVPGSGVQSKVLKPFIYAGIVSVDDGKLWKNFDPHENVIQIEKSPVEFELPISQRIDLIRKNYEVTLEGVETIAGRKATVVHMHGVHGGMSDRVLKIDQETSLILAYEIHNEDATSSSEISTSTVTIGETSQHISIDELGSTSPTVRKKWGPVDVKSPKEAATYVGFTPKLPTELPAGLHIQAIHVVSHKDAKFVGVRLTDGMSMVTAYLWNPEHKKGAADEPFGGKAMEVSASGIKLRVEGEVAAWVKRDLAKAFAGLN